MSGDSGNNEESKSNGASSSSSSSTSTSVSSMNPNFSGVWRSISHENMQPFLKARGFSDANAQLASNAVVTQTIKHTARVLEITVNDSVQVYQIQGGDSGADTVTDDSIDNNHEDESSSEGNLANAFFQKTAEWLTLDDQIRQLVSSTGEIDTVRSLDSDGRMIVAVTTATSTDGEITAKTIFVKQ